MARWGDFYWGDAVWGGDPSADALIPPATPLVFVYTVELDAARNNFASGVVDLTRYLKSVSWSNGMDAQEGGMAQEFASPSRANFVFLSQHDEFLPELTTAPLYGLLRKGTILRVKVTWNGDTFTLYHGKIKKTRYVHPANNPDPLVGVETEDQLWRLLDSEFYPELLQDTTPGGALGALFRRPLTVWPYASNYWMLGVVGSSELGSATQLYQNEQTDFEAGMTALPFVGDHLDSGRGVSAQTYLRDVVASEAGGRFWFDTRTALWAFTGRGHDALNDTIAATLDVGQFASVSYIGDADLLNDLTINYTPREIGSAGEVIFQQSGAFSVKGRGKRKTITARYSDPDDRTIRVGAKDYIQPVRGFDFTATTRGENGETVDGAAKVFVHVRWFADKAEITIRNNNYRDAEITLLRLRATPLRLYQRAIVQADDPQSIADNDLYAKTLNIPSLSDADFAEQYAKFLVARYKDPIYRLNTVTFYLNDSAAMASQGLRRVVNDRVRLTDTRLNHDREYIIVGEHHQVDAAMRTHLVTWVLAPADRTRYWRLGVTGFGELGTTTTLML